MAKRGGMRLQVVNDLQRRREGKGRTCLEKKSNFDKPVKGVCRGGGEALRRYIGRLWTEESAQRKGGATFSLALSPLERGILVHPGSASFKCAERKKDFSLGGVKGQRSKEPRPSKEASVCRAIRNRWLVAPTDISTDAKS